MKTKTIAGTRLVMIALMSCAFSISAQEVAILSNQEIRVKKKTVMEQYEPGMVLTVEDRMKLKRERVANIQKRRDIIDTLDLSNRKRRRLLKELYGTPHSDQWEKIIADKEFDADHPH